MSAMRAWCAFVLLAACGRIGFDDVLDAGGDGSVAGRWLAVETGGRYACGIATDHSLWCWGMIPLDPGGKRIEPPQQIAGSWSAVSIASTAASANDHTCGIQTDGSLWCWGFNTFGALGNGSTGDSAIPVQVGSATWTAVAAGNSFTCGIQADRSLWCWGHNATGELGDGTTNQHASPTRISGVWTAIAAGDSYACAINTDTALWCWGDNTAGELGDGTMIERDGGVEIGTGFMMVAASPTGDHTCGIAGGTVTCWGHDGFGQLGDGTTNTSLSPVATGRHAQQVAVGDNHSCAIDSGTLWCWGSGDHGELAAASTAQTPVQVGSAVAVATGESQTCIVDATNHLSCTGRNSFGQLGPAISPGEVHVATRADTRTDWQSITAGGTHTCGSTTSGDAMCWGLNSFGELGDGTQIDRQQPVAVPVPGTSISQVTAGPYQTVLVSSAGDAFLLGDDIVVGMNETVPEQLPMTGWSIETAGEQHSCGITGGALWCRGDDTYGQLGDSMMTGLAHTSQVAGVWEDVSADFNTTCGISNSTILCWGDGSFGQIGDGTTNSYSTPQGIAIGGAPSAISVGNEFTCAIRVPGAILCWGENAIGQLGDGTTNDSHSPVQAGIQTNWMDVVAGFVHACAITDDHALYCWGGGGEGELGNDFIGNEDAPTQVGSDHDWAEVAVGWTYTCAIKTGGTRWCWGTDYDGQLGNGLAWHAGFVEVP
jgi:alpha-tubulin suppressor-like RCC1 family protein